MTRRKKLPHWQIVALSKFHEILTHPDFKEDVSILKKLVLYDSISFDSGMHIFCAKYNLPKAAYGLAKHYVIFDEIDPNKVISPIFLVSEVDDTVHPSDRPDTMMDAYKLSLGSGRKRVYLDLTSDTQPEDISDFIKLYFPLVKKKLKLLDKTRPSNYRARYTLKQRYKVIELYKKYEINRPKQGIQRTIEIKTKLSPATIKKIIEEYRTQRKYDLYPLLNNIGQTEL